MRLISALLLVMYLFSLSFSSSFSIRLIKLAKMAHGVEVRFTKARPATVNNVRLAELMTDPPVVHAMPCKIESVGPAAVKKFFEPSIQQPTVEDQDLKAIFRGRPLNGQSINIPDGHSAFVVVENRSLERQDEKGNTQKTFEVLNHFQSFHLWNLDQRISPNDPLPKALRWLSIAKSLHGE